MKVLVLGGTKDSINIIKHMKKNYTTEILTTTTTEYGAKLAKEGGSDYTIAKPLLKDEIIKIITENNFDILIDATHPFAEHITKTSISIKNQINIPYIRFERPATNLEKNIKHIYYVNSFDSAGKLIKDKFSQSNILHFAGANTMESILKYVSCEKFYPRILKVKSSIDKCEKLHVDPSHIIPMTGTASKEENIKLIEKYNAGVIITKESGEIGGVIDKVEAAKEKKIDIIIVLRPKIEELNKEDIVSNLDELDKKIKSFLK